MARSVLRRKHRKICVGDMRDRISLQTRAITEPAFSTTNFTETFAGADKTWAKVVTIAGKTVFDGVNQDVALSHEVTIRFDSGVTAETWVLLANGSRLDVIVTEDLEERNEYLLLKCRERGTKDKAATAA